MSVQVLVCFAVPQEAKPFRKQVSRQPGIRLLVTGMGRKNAESAVTRALAQQTPSQVFTCGFAGALDPGLRVGDVLFETSSEAFQQELIAAGARAGRIACAERVAVTMREKKDLALATGAAAIEMESGWIQSLCRHAGVPCATLRAISDEAGEDLPLDFNALMTADHQLSPAKVALAILRQPHRIPALLRLGHQSTLAAEKLAAVLCRVLSIQ